MAIIKTLNDLTTQERAEYDVQQQAYEAAAPERAWLLVRVERDELLKATDWAALPDSSAYSPELIAYRQALRDIPSQFTNPDDVVWPVNPLKV